MSAAYKKYSFKHKNTWRLRVYKEIKDRIKKGSIRTQDAVVLYLAGAEDLDRRILRWHGFREENLYIVERDPRIVKQHRDAGKLVLEGDINEHLMAWNGTVDVVVADFCCGLTQDAMTFLLMMVELNKLSQDGVVMVNLLRGRDAWSNEAIAEYKTVFNMGKNRADLFMMMLHTEHYKRVLKPWLLKEHPEQREENNSPAYKTALNFTRDRLDATFYTYASNTVKMDSVVFNAGVFGGHGDALGFVRAGDIDQKELQKGMDRVHACRRQQSAIKATSTRRKNVKT